VNSPLVEAILRWGETISGVRQLNKLAHGVEWRLGAYTTAG
jgi:hypothetical protein